MNGLVDVSCFVCARCAVENLGLLVLSLSSKRVRTSETWNYVEYIPHL